MPGNNRAIRGRYRGQLLDDSSRHSIRIRKQHVNGQHDDRFIVEHFYHDGEFWTATIPLDSVSEIIGQAFNFSKPKIRNGPDGPQQRRDKLGIPKRKLPFLNHLQTRFRMQPGHHVELYPAGADVHGKPTHRVGDFVYSVEAIGPPGVNFGFRDGLNGSLVSAHRFLSTQEMVFERIAVEGQYVLESPPLPLTGEQRRALLVGSLERSHRAGMREPYYLYRFGRTNNCTSNPFQLLDQTVNYPWWRRPGVFLYRLPLRPRWYLRVRGMDTAPRVRKLLRDEYADFIADRATQRRKREYVKTRVRLLRQERAMRRSARSASDIGTSG